MEVGADLRSRFGKLQTSVKDHVDRTTQLLESVSAYEGDYDKLNEWLSGKVGTIGSLSPPALTVGELKEQLQELEVSISPNLIQCTVHIFCLCLKTAVSFHWLNIQYSPLSSVFILSSI